MNEVVRFLELKHPRSYKVYNLCSERSYPCKNFKNRGSCPSPPSPPPLQDWLPALPAPGSSLCSALLSHSHSNTVHGSGAPPQPRARNYRRSLAPRTACHRESRGAAPRVPDPRGPRK